MKHVYNVAFILAYSFIHVHTTLTLKLARRDVACRNCLVNSNRMAKLADFGMARPMYENDYYRFHRKGEVVGRNLLPFLDSL